jgi:tRNA pseudouridine38-40 synthase
MRYFFEIAYNGKNYNGWQSQQNGLGVQAVVENALVKLLQQRIEIVGSGRTDTGVHCQQQFFHADIEKEFDISVLIIKLNSFLPSGIAIRNIIRVRPDASARYDAVERTYRYQITRKKDPFLEGYAWHFFKPLQLETMNNAAALLIGEKDFECFSKVNTDVNHFLCDIKYARWYQEGDLLFFTITANRFLRGMVRAVVGTLLDVGIGKTSTDDFIKIINGRDRRKAGANVPPYGLFLMQVKYPSEVFLN